MVKSILVAIDSSSFSQGALPAAIEIAGQFDSEILVLHVREHDSGRAVVYLLDEAPPGVTTMVADAVKKLRDLGRVARGQVRNVAAGHAAKAIVEAAQANGVDLIVLGSRGPSEVHGLLVGSVAQDVMQAVDIPLLVVRPPVAERARSRRLSSVKA